MLGDAYKMDTLLGIETEDGNVWERSQSYIYQRFFVHHYLAHAPMLKA